MEYMFLYSSKLSHFYIKGLSNLLPLYISHFHAFKKKKKIQTISQIIEFALILQVSNHTF